MTFTALITVVDGAAAVQITRHTDGAIIGEQNDLDLEEALDYVRRWDKLDYYPELEDED